MPVLRFPRWGCSARGAALFFLIFAASARVRGEDLAGVPNTWTATATLGAPSGRERHTAVWTGAKMIVWGGDAGMVSEPTLGNGGVYDPVSNTWSPVASAGAPTARESATAVWTGSGMIVWGGIKFNAMSAPSVFANGGIYDPVTNSWKPVATLGAPAARLAHTAVWTGSEMIVWGGDTSSFFFAPPNGLSDGMTKAGQAVIDAGAVNSGGIYDPATNTWRAVSTLGAPSPRAYHTAVWTGDRMIVWGGDDGHLNYLGSGGIYDPSTDTWSPLPTLGAPSARAYHTAVWTGSQMIVWGGYSTDDVRTGGVFDPDTNGWTPTALTGSPSAREYHAAVPFRGHMIVWGGWTGNDDVNSGGIYDPETDTWTATSLTGAPSGREQATAVFTGSAMIVWGGLGGSHPVNSGGIYTPPVTPCPTLRGCITAVPAPDAAVVSTRP